MNLSLHINNHWTNGEGTSINLTNPCTGLPAGQFNSASPEQVAQALQSARQSFPAWAATPLEERKSILLRYAELIEQNKTKLANSIARDAGKPLWEANIETSAMRGKIDISIAAQESRCATFGNEPSLTRYRPQGVAVVLGPFNFPGHLPNGHIVPALLAGNTVVFKPSELTPRTANLIVGLLLEAGIPTGAIQLVHGVGSVGALLTNSNEPDAIFFTGSSATGKRIAAANIDRPGRMIALEMGGNNPLVVTEVDDIKAAALTIVQSAFITAGQRCTCARRLILVDSKSNRELIAEFVRMSGTIRVGCPADDPAPFIGPVISAAAAESVINAQHSLISRGAKNLLKARILKEGTGFISPAILDVTDLRDATDEEIFGPLLQVTWVSNLDAAIAGANNTSYGLAAGLLSKNESDYRRFRFEIRAGLINWNQQLTGASSSAPFGGVGDSGNQRPGAYFAADYCNYPVASFENTRLKLPSDLPAGIDVQTLL